MTLSGLVEFFLVELSRVVLIYFFFVNGVYLMLTGAAVLELRRHSFEQRGQTKHDILSSSFVPSIAVLVPAYNEALTISESVNSLLTLSYPSLEVVVVDDGSTDDTIGVLTQEYELQPIEVSYPRTLQTQPVLEIYRSAKHSNLIVARKENGGKADSLNAATNLASCELVCALDADTLVEEDAMHRLVRPFLRSDKVVAAGATIRIVNACHVNHGRLADVRVPRAPLPGLQAMEYLRAFLFGRLGWNRLGGNLVISGAFGLFRRDALVAVGGYSKGVGEDIELIVRLRRHGREQGKPALVEFVPDPVAWTEAPESLRVLSRQRDRWQRGLADTMWRHKDVVGRKKYGSLGLVAMPIFILIELLAPILEAVGILAMLLGLSIGAVDLGFAAVYLALVYGLAIAQSVSALLLEELSFRRYGTTADRLILLLWALLEHLGYRQLTVWWRLRGMYRFVRGDSEWGTMERAGFQTSPGSPLPQDNS